jgi:hypothetical protein
MKGRTSRDQSLGTWGHIAAETGLAVVSGLADAMIGSERRKNGEPEPPA